MNKKRIEIIWDLLGKINKVSEEAIKELNKLENKNQDILHGDNEEYMRLRNLLKVIIRENTDYALDLWCVIASSLYNKENKNE